MPDDIPEPDTSVHPMLGVHLRLVHQHWVQAIDAALDEAGFGDLRPSHANVFTFVPPDGIQVSVLTRLAQMRKQSMAQVVEELEQLGYVERRPDPRDRRARLVFLTARGEAVRPVSLAAGQRVMARWAELTSAQELAALERALAVLLARLREEAGAATLRPGPPAT